MVSVTKLVLSNWGCLPVAQREVRERPFEFVCLFVCLLLLGNKLFRRTPEEGREGSDGTNNSDSEKEEDDAI